MRATVSALLAEKEGILAVDEKQPAAMKTWAAAPATNTGAAQAALLHRARCYGLAGRAGIRRRRSTKPPLARQNFVGIREPSQS